MPDALAAAAARYDSLAAEIAELKKRLPAAQQELPEVRRQLAAAIAEDIRSGRRTQVEVSAMTGYTPERIRQICRAEGVPPSAPGRPKPSPE